MRKILLVIDMQNDFIDGALGSAEAVAIIPAVSNLISSFDGDVYFTRDTHYENYMETQEGRNLPVPHCINGTDGWQITSMLDTTKAVEIIDKPTFGYLGIPEVLKKRGEDISEITVIGVCTDICVISNVMILKAAFPEAKISVVASACAGVTPQSHEKALDSMKMCQVNII